MYYKIIYLLLILYKYMKANIDCKTKCVYYNGHDEKSLLFWNKYT